MPECAICYAMKTTTLHFFKCSVCIEGKCCSRYFSKLESSHKCRVPNGHDKYHQCIARKFFYEVPLWCKWKQCAVIAYCSTLFTIIIVFTCISACIWKRRRSKQRRQQKYFHKTECTKNEQLKINYDEYFDIKLLDYPDETRWSTSRLSNDDVPTTFFSINFWHLCSFFTYVYLDYSDFICIHIV